MKPAVDLVIFGGTGDLSTRKLLPALFQLQRHGLTESLDRIICTGRGTATHEEFRDTVKQNLQRYLPEQAWSENEWNTYSTRLYYSTIQADDPTNYQILGKLLNSSDSNTQLYYMATLPSLYGGICQQLQDAGLVNPDSSVVLEKPIGNDLRSCQEINEQVAKVFSEEKTFRIDHYLGKETVQ
ncbi:MAG: glucose-6-phosphate dehydrogenase, partial [Pseudomonadota bacterium]